MDHWKTIVELASANGATPEQIKKWRQRGKVSSTWHLRLLGLAAEKGVDLPASALTDLPGRSSEAA